jgi:hypothetical protein
MRFTHDMKIGNSYVLVYWIINALGRLWLGTLCTLLKKSNGNNVPLSVNFVYAWKNYSTSTKLTLSSAPFPSIDGKLFCFCNSVAGTMCDSALCCGRFNDKLFRERDNYIDILTRLYPWKVCTWVIICTVLCNTIFLLIIIFCMHPRLRREREGGRDAHIAR